MCYLLGFAWVVAKSNNVSRPIPRYKRLYTPAHTHTPVHACTRTHTHAPAHVCTPNTYTCTHLHLHARTRLHAPAHTRLHTRAQAHRVQSVAEALGVNLPVPGFPPPHRKPAGARPQLRLFRPQPGHNCGRRVCVSRGRTRMADCPQTGATCVRKLLIPFPGCGPSSTWPFPLTWACSRCPRVPDGSARLRQTPGPRAGPGW